jgi:hypothetical protein
MSQFSNNTNSKNVEFIKFSGLKNGFLNKLIDIHHERQDKKTTRLEFYEVMNIVFMFIILVRTFISLTISDEDPKLAMYIGRPWNLLGAHYVNSEILFISWSLNFICIYAFVIQSPTKIYKWIEVYAFLKGVLPCEQIGKHLLILIFITFFINKINF